ncbi:metallophosphoesterase [Lacticaseibacillus parakribbianus]|uniref:metallophosphoesterase n=1 Tax=Lacticaseibacillus parakribbianus TaxID=2970927 RepID=UPI0021CB99A6|nr:metallophosphoesterase [Lacticaseibacillus parakribbianus]
MIVIALGDLHGQLAVLPRLRRVQARYPEATTVFIGDYIDCFGDDNPGLALLAEIRAIEEADPLHTKALMGNHEYGAVSFFSDPAKRDWLHYGGAATLAAEAKRLGLSPTREVPYASEQLALAVRQALLAREPTLLDWTAALPMSWSVGRLTFVHAGLDQTSNHPFEDSTVADYLWLRGGYWYDPNNWQVFDHNRFGRTVVAGHTPTGMIAGRYHGDVRAAKLASPRNPIYAIQYPGEPPRYLIDGGAGGRDPRLLGNIGVFDSETGLLMDAVED